MEDLLIREIKKFAEALAALLQKIGLLKKEDRNTCVMTFAKVELLAKLNIDLDELIAAPDAAEVLVREHGADDQSLEMFAELLYDLASASVSAEERLRLAETAFAIYRYLDSAGNCISINRMHIIQELKKYMA